MIEFTHTPTFADYLRLNRHVLFKSTRKLVWISLAMVGVYLVFPWAMRQNGVEMTTLEAYRMGLGMLILPGFIALMFALTFNGARLRWKRASELRSPKFYRIGEDGVYVRGEGLDGSLSWNHIVHAELKGDWFYLKTGQIVFYHFPKGSVSDVQGFVDLVTRKVEKCEGMKKA